MPPVVLAHVAAGSMAIGAGYYALAAPKRRGGSHVLAGQVFAAAMLATALLAAVIAMVRHEGFSLIAALVTAYLVASSWHTVRASTAGGRRFEVVACMGAIAVAALGIAMGVNTARGFGEFNGKHEPAGSATIYFLFAALALWGAWLDRRVIREGMPAGNARLARHLWRMLSALTIASASFFLGQQKIMPLWIRGAHLAIPPLIALAAIPYWLWRAKRGALVRRGNVVSNLGV